MGMLIHGRWSDEDVKPAEETPDFRRPESKFRSWVTADGRPGPTGVVGFPAEAGRYHLFIASNCPWAHRTAIYRKLKGLEDVISVSLADAPKAQGWSYRSGIDELQPGPDGILRLHQVYTAANPQYSGKVTVPTLWDRKTKTIVSNESPEIIRMMNSAFDAVGANDLDFYPTDLRREIDVVNMFVYEHVNNGVYRACFAKTQAAYDEAVKNVFIGLDWMEAKLGAQRYIAGDRPTEADWRAFPTLIRFDLVYYSLFRCNIRRVQDYPSLMNYTRELYQWPGVKETCNLATMKSGYYESMPHLNPGGIVPAGPDMGWVEDKHDRARLPGHPPGPKPKAKAKSKR